jgi:hypothetical protein
MLASITRHDQARSRSLGFAIRPFPIALTLLALLTVLRVGGTVDSDVAWQLWIAQRMHRGADLYRDIIETNPPLWFWMARPIERLSSLLHLRIESALVIVIAAVAGLSLAAANRLLGHLAERQRALLLPYAVLTLFAMPWTHVGQREQIVLIVTLPYAVLIASRREARPVPMLLAAGIGAAAALGFALKHYFVLVPLLLELWLLAIQRKDWRPLRAETVAMAAVGAGYAAAILAERDYITSIVPLLTQAYGSYAAPGFRNLFGPLAAITAVIAVTLLLNVRLLSRRDASVAAALTIAALGFAVSYVVQFKGWPYHAIPMLGCASLALVAMLTGIPAPARAFKLIGPALLCLPLSIAGGEALHETSPDRDLEQAIAGLPPGAAVGFIAENTALAWSVVLQRQFSYPQRYNGYWMLGAFVRAEQEGRHDPGLQAAWRKAVADTVADFRCLPPRRIIVARPQAGSWNAGIVDPLPYFRRDPGFAELLSHYRVVSRTTLEVYEQVTPIPKTATANCVRGR